MKHIPYLKMGSWWVAIGALVVVAFLLGLGIATFQSSEYEIAQLQMVVIPMSDWEADSSKWGQNYPNEYDTYVEKRSGLGDGKNENVELNDYLEEDPRLVVLYAGHRNGKNYNRPRGHRWSLEDVDNVKETMTALEGGKAPSGTCITCKSADIPRLLSQQGIATTGYKDWSYVRKQATHPIGCIDCHDPKTMDLKISRPQVTNGITGKNGKKDKISHQQKRSLVCAQCHAEYYVEKSKGKSSLKFPWDLGTSPKEMERYYDQYPEYNDWIHPISKTPMIKISHPDWEAYRAGIHYAQGVACADCHMPYRISGGLKYTDHSFQNPLENLDRSCGVCHRVGKDRLLKYVKTMQKKHKALKIKTEDLLVKAHFDIAECMKAGVEEEDLRNARVLLKRAQLRWDYVNSNNGMGFHSPLESAVTLGESIGAAQEVRIRANRILAQHGISSVRNYPDISSKEKARKVVGNYTKTASSLEHQLPSESDAGAEETKASSHEAGLSDLGE
jgi:nitrite reductase (cytochrome c-552)